MSSLLDSLSDNQIPGQIKNAATDFVMRLNTYRDIAVNNYNKYNIDLNDSIAKLARENNLNDNQISRIIEEVNNSVFLIKYASIKQYPDRDVVFDLAKLPEIKIRMNEKAAKKEEKTLEKTASTKNAGDRLNFLNFSTHDVGNLAPDRYKSFDTIQNEKLASEIKNLEEEMKLNLMNTAENIYTVAEALIRYDRMNKNAQEIFDEICKGAGLKKQDQIIYKKAVDQKISQFKEYRMLPENYNFNLDLVDINKVSEFSLGKYSFIEKKSEQIPTVVVDNNKIVKNLNQLINAAKVAQNNQVDYQKSKNKKESLKLKGVK